MVQFIKDLWETKTTAKFLCCESRHHFKGNLTGTFTGIELDCLDPPVGDTSIPKHIQGILVSLIFIASMLWMDVKLAKGDQ